MTDDIVRHVRKYTRFSFQEKAIIADRHKSGESGISLAKEFGVTRERIYKISGELGFRKNPPKYTINKNCFSTITPESAYWIGMLMTDGNISGSRINLSQADKDAGHIEKFKQFICTSRKVEMIAIKKTPPMINGRPVMTKDGMRRIQFRCSQMVNDLKKYGIIPRKSHTAKVIGLESDRDFWRGVIDGDGCVCLTKRKRDSKVRAVISLVGNEFLLTQFSIFTKQFCPNSSATVHKCKNKNLYQVQIYTKDAIKMLEVIYKDSVVFLDRKYRKAINIIHGQF